jgi:hypothetical protein
MSEYKYDYLLDKDGPEGIPVESWLENNNYLKVNYVR